MCKKHKKLSEQSRAEQQQAAAGGIFAKDKQANKCSTDVDGGAMMKMTAATAEWQSTVGKLKLKTETQKIPNKKLN